MSVFYEFCFISGIQLNTTLHYHAGNIKNLTWTSLFRDKHFIVKTRGKYEQHWRGANETEHETMKKTNEQ